MPTRELQLVLASGSPRRRELLDQLGLSYRVVITGLDESPIPRETAGKYALRMASAKAAAGWKLSGLPPLPVLGADTVVVVDGQMLGKPENPEEAAGMLKMLSGKSHDVISAVAIIYAGESCEQRVSTTRVCFKSLSAVEIAAYCHTGEPLDKAGAYGIQGFAAGFIENINGSYSGVMGLPLFETIELLGLAGIKIF